VGGDRRAAPSGWRLTGGCTARFFSIAESTRLIGGPDGYRRAGIADTGEKNGLFLAEKLSKLQFYVSSTLYRTVPN
jgi:hypothetical protein